MKEAGIIIDLYQPHFQEDSSIRKVVSDFYIPLLKTIKSNKDISFSINIPLSTLEMLDRLNFESVISDIKDLYQNDRVEILGSFPYGGDFSNFPQDLIESQIILNEYGVGYYLGSKQGFEGEPSIMTKDIIGFLPSYGQSNKGLIDILEGLGYRWSAFKGNKLVDRSVKKIENSDFIISQYIDDINELLIELGNNSAEKDYEMKKNSTYSCIDKIYKEAKDSNSNYLILNIGSIDVLKTKEHLDYKELFNVFIWTLERLADLGVRIKTVSEIIKKDKKISRVGQEETTVFLENEKVWRKVNDMSNLQEAIVISIENLAKAISNIKNIDSISPFKLWRHDNGDNNIITQYHIYTYIYSQLSKMLPVKHYLTNEEYHEHNSIAAIFNDKLNAITTDIDEKCQKIDSDEVKNHIINLVSVTRNTLKSRFNI
ncbi:hypothetical protein K0B04_01850 [Patescibacteria group bacterium]|nr:hypothetical protein [Patescibacteria group bacterium]